MRDLPSDEALQVASRRECSSSVTRHIVFIVGGTHSNIAPHALLPLALRDIHVTRLLQCLVRRLEHLALLGVHLCRLTGALLEELVIKRVWIVDHVGEPLAVELLLPEGRLEYDALHGDLLGLGVAVEKQVVELRHIVRTGHLDRHANHGNIIATDLRNAGAQALSYLGG